MLVPYGMIFAPYDNSADHVIRQILANLAELGLLRFEVGPTRPGNVAGEGKSANPGYEGVAQSHESTRPPPHPAA